MHAGMIFLGKLFSNDVMVMKRTSGVWYSLEDSHIILIEMLTCQNQRQYR